VAFKDILTMLEDALEELVTLEIVTAVGPVAPSPPPDASGKRPKAALDPSAKVMRTRIDVLHSAVTTEIDPAFATGDYQNLRAFHADREKQATDLFKGHVDTIKSIFELIKAHTPTLGA
jgi:hypothetical protein